MSDTQKIYTPSTPLPPARTGLLTAFEPGTRTLEKGFQIAPQFRPIPVDIVFEKDVAVQLRDGVTIYVDVFRPAGSEKVPVIVAWSPYGKGQGTSVSVMGVFGLVGLNNNVVSGLAKFEAPDPAYWCANGYAICNPDIRGCVDSEGNSVLWDRQDGRDCHDLIKALPDQSIDCIISDPPYGTTAAECVHGGEKTIQWSACVCAGAGGVKVGHWIG